MGDLKSLKQERKAFYDSIVSVNCPILGDTVYFTSQGFYHLTHESNSFQHNSNMRNVNEQYMKLKLLKNAPKIIKNATKLITRPVSKTVKGKIKPTIQYGLVCEVEKGIKMRVIVERIGDGKHKFLSIMLHDGPSKRNHKNKRRH